MSVCRMKFVVAVMMALSLVMPSITLSASNFDDTAQSLRESIREVASAAFPEDVHPGGSVLVAWDGVVVFAEGYGITDYETIRPITPNTHFRLASISKQFTAMAILVLIEQGRLSLDETLTDIFPDFPAYGNAITVHHLLNHSSGLKDYESLIPEEQKAQLLDRDVLRISMAQEDTYFVPGSEFRYSNTGYALLAMIIEARSGKRFAEFLDTALFEPLGLETAVAFEDGVSEVPYRAYGHYFDDDKLVFGDQSMTSAVLGDGGIYMSTLEYAKWHVALMDDPPVSKRMMKNAFTAYFPRDEESGYGYGWQVMDSPAGQVVFHGGSTIGFINYAVRIPEQGLAVITLSNRREDIAGDLTREITDMVLSHYGHLSVFD